MPTSTSSVLFAASLCVAAAAQHPASTAPAPDPTANAGGGGGASNSKPAASRLLDRLSAEIQEPDYSLRGMFQKEHGDFMLRRERFNPMIEISGSSITDASVSSETGRFDEYHVQADAEIPVTVSTDGYLMFGGFYESRHYNTRNMPGFADENLYSAGAKFGFGWFLDNNDVLIEGKIDPGSWSDWDGTLHHQDFDYPASLLATVRYSNEFFWKVGVRYNEVFEDANVLPWLGISWVGESIRVDVLLPENLEVSLWPSPDFGILLGAQIEGAEYHVRSSAATGHQEGNARVQEALVYAGALWRMNDYASFGARVGAVVAGDYKLDDGNGATARVTGTLDPALFVEISFGLDF